MFEVIALILAGAAAALAQRYLNQTRAKRLQARSRARPRTGSAARRPSPQPVTLALRGAGGTIYVAAHGSSFALTGPAGQHLAVHLDRLRGRRHDGDLAAWYWSYGAAPSSWRTTDAASDTSAGRVLLLKINKSSLLSAMSHAGRDRQTWNAELVRVHDQRAHALAIERVPVDRHPIAHGLLR
jgi:hypothetical protein